MSLCSALYNPQLKKQNCDINTVCWILFFFRRIADVSFSDLYLGYDGN